MSSEDLKEVKVEGMSGESIPLLPKASFSSRQHRSNYGSKLQAVSERIS